MVLVMVPVLQVNYFRKRFRSFDYRFNLDSGMIIQGRQEHIDRPVHQSLIPFAVLEIKLGKTDLYPTLGGTDLSLSSFSKYGIEGG